MTNLTIVANIVVNEDKLDVVKKELLKLIPLTLAEEGCLQYDLHQDNDKPNHFVFYENWETRELWQNHMSSQHIKDYIKATDGLVKEFVVSEMTLIK